MLSQPQAKSEDCSATPFKKVEKFEEISLAVRLLQRDGVEERRDSGLAKEDGDVRVILAKLGAIPPLLEMLDHDDQIRDEIRVEALYALLNLGIGNDLNKAAIVQAGALHKMLKMTRLLLSPMAEGEERVTECCSENKEPEAASTSSVSDGSGSIILKSPGGSMTPPTASPSHRYTHAYSHLCILLYTLLITIKAYPLVHIICQLDPNISRHYGK